MGRIRIARRAAPSARRARHATRPATVAAGHGLRIESGSLAGVLLAVPRNGLTLGHPVARGQRHFPASRRAAARDRGFGCAIWARAMVLCTGQTAAPGVPASGERLVLETSYVCIDNNRSNGGKP